MLNEQVLCPMPWASPGSLLQPTLSMGHSGMCNSVKAWLVTHSPEGHGVTLAGRAPQEPLDLAPAGRAHYKLFL